MSDERVCACRHPWHEHHLIKGWECSPGVTIDGQTSVPDVWVCSGGRLVADPENASPWDFVCGCVLHEAPSTEAASTYGEAFMDGARAARANAQELAAERLTGDLCTCTDRRRCAARFEIPAHRCRIKRGMDFAAPRDGMRFDISQYDDGQIYVGENGRPMLHAKIRGEHDVEVQIGSHNDATVEIDKLYGPLVFWPIRVKLDVDSCEWVIERCYGPEGEWREVIRIPGQLDADFSDD